VSFFKKKSTPSAKPEDKLRLEREALLASGQFDADWYLGYNPDVAAAGMDAATHYLLFGRAEGRRSCPSPEERTALELERQLEKLRSSDWFDADWYQAHYPDVVEAGQDPALHYLLFGEAEGRLPGPPADGETGSESVEEAEAKALLEERLNSLRRADWFDAEWYLQNNPDLAASGTDPALHYLLFGEAEGRRPGPTEEEKAALEFERQLARLKASSWFDADWYLANNPDVADAGADAALHYLKNGEAEGRQPGPMPDAWKGAPIDHRIWLLLRSEWFDAGWYLANSPDVVAAGIDPALHYFLFGAAEGRAPGPLFDEEYYLSQLTEPLNQPSGLFHYLLYGKAAGLKPVRDWSEGFWWQQLGSSGHIKADRSTFYQTLAARPLPVLIIPVFNAADSLRLCLQSVARHSTGIGQVLLINDASTDPAIDELLVEYQSHPLFTIYVNESNQGFSRTVNKGMALAEDADVIILNSDTQVTPGFARHLRYLAYSGEKIATVTPVSNNAGPFSVPNSGSNSLPEGFTLDRFARAINQANVVEPIAVPTGHGFCMYIRRDALRDVGDFDAEAFPRGYGEENDFCMRARSHGWQHLIDPATYIYHQGAASFGEDKAALLIAGRSVLLERYPDYPHQVSQAFGSNKVKALRKRIATLANMPESVRADIKPRVLFVISTLTGGTPQTNQDLMAALDNRIECLLLHSDSQTLTLKYFSSGIFQDLASHKLAEPIHALPHTSDEYDEVVGRWLMEWSVELVHIRHLAWHGLGLLHVAKALSIPIVKSIHDFYTLCPTVKLLDDRMTYCGAVCTSGEGVCQHEIWPKDAFRQLKHEQIQTWQQEFARTLQLCDVLVTTSAVAKDLLLERYPHLAEKPFPIIHHGRDFGQFYTLAERPDSGEKLRIICPGHINEAKGLRLICELAQLGEAIEIHILGSLLTEEELPPNIIVHGTYRRGEFAHRVARIKPHCGAILSIWPETWCHTLTELWSVGVPVIANPIGAVGDRIAEHRAGWLLKDRDTAALQEVIAQVRDPDNWHEKQQAVIRWQKESGAAETCAAMADEYMKLYNTWLSLERV
jgi:GT2 family glycosyltransferase